MSAKDRELLLGLEEQPVDGLDGQVMIAELDRRRRRAESGEVRMLDRLELERAIAQRRAARRSS